MAKGAKFGCRMASFGEPAEGERMKTLVLTSLVTILVMVFFLEENGAIGKDFILVAYDFEQIERDVVKDVSGHDNDGTLVGAPQQVDGVVGKALEFDGGADFLDLGDNHFLFDELTILFWANQMGSGADCCPTYFVVREADGSACGIFSAGPPKTVRAFCFKPPTFGEEAIVQKGAIEDDDWHHIAAVFSGVSGRELYIDGDLVANNEKFKSSFDDLKGTNTFIARGRTLNPIEQVKGAIDEFAIVKKALTDAEIRQSLQGVAEILAVQPLDKLTTTWGWIKEGS
jgi:hypothetical protein